MPMSESTKDVFQKWAALPEWEQQARRFGANENAIKLLKIISTTVAMLSWPFRGWMRKEN
jgi:hypothetical protein